MKIVALFKFVYGSLLVMLLLASFGLHAIQVEHEHYGVSDHHNHTASGDHTKNDQETSVFSSLGEYMHAADKKLWYILPAPLFASLSVLAALCGSWYLFMEFIRRQVALIFIRRRLEAFLRRNYLNFFYSQGLYNPKLH